MKANEVAYKTKKGERMQEVPVYVDITKLAKQMLDHVPAYADKYNAKYLGYYYAIEVMMRYASEQVTE